MKIKEHSNNLVNPFSSRLKKRILSLESKSSKKEHTEKIIKKIFQKKQKLKNIKKKKIDLSESILTNCSSDKLKIIFKNIEKRKNPNNQNYKIYIKNEKKNNIRKKKEKSPLKTKTKYIIRKKLIKKANSQKNAISQEIKKLSQKEKIIQNIFYKNEKYYYYDKINFSTILKLIYYENYKIEDIKDYIPPSFKKLTDIKNFFEILINEAKDFSENIRFLLTKKINKLIIKKEDKNFFRIFSKFPKKYFKIINELFFYYKYLENINFEIEKLTRIYLDNYIDKNKKFSFDTLQFHKKMFIDKVYNDSLIRKFIIYLFEFFKKNHFYLNKFSSSILKIEEIYENLESVNNKEESVSSENEEILENAKKEDFSKIEKIQDLTEEEIQNRKRLKRKLKRKRKKNKKNKKLEYEKLNKDIDSLIRKFDHFDKICKKFDFSPKICITFCKKDLESF